MQVPSMLQGDSLKRVRTGPTTGPSQHRIGSARNLSTRYGCRDFFYARQYEAIERLFQGTGYKLALRREDRAA
jgi:hypothetical protein